MLLILKFIQGGIKNVLEVLNLTFWNLQIPWNTKCFFIPSIAGYFPMKLPLNMFVFFSAKQQRIEIKKLRQGENLILGFSIGGGIDQDPGQNPFSEDKTDKVSLQAQLFMHYTCVKSPKNVVCS